MKVDIDKDEWWPVYTIENLDGDTEHWVAYRGVEVDEAFVERWKAANREFSECQEIIGALVDRHLGRMPRPLGGSSGD